MAARAAHFGMDAEAILRSDDPVFILAVSAVVEEADKLAHARDKVRAQYIANEVAKKF